MLSFMDMTWSLHSREAGITSTKPIQDQASQHSSKDEGRTHKVLPLAREGSQFSLGV